MVTKYSPVINTKAYRTYAYCTEDKNGRFVHIDDYAALQQKLDAMAAENAALKSVIEAVRGVADNSNGIAGWHLNGEIARWDEILPEIEDIETTATDTYLNSVRAEGVERFINEFAYEIPHRIKCGLMSYANQLRSGTHDTADKAG